MADAREHMADDQSELGSGPEGSGPLEVQGRVVRTVYHDANTRYMVLKVQLPGELGAVSFVGRHGGVEDGAQIDAMGHWGEHPSHGRQFEFVRLRISQPTTEVGVLRRLMRYPGVRETMARRIFEAFGLETLKILDSHPERLLEVEGIGRKTLERIREYHASREGPLVELENRLIELDLSPSLAERIHRRFGEASLEMLESHPYRLAREVRGIGFVTADRIARALGVAQDSEERIDAGVVYALERAERDGHCALPDQRLIDEARRILGRPAAEIEAGIERLLEHADLVYEPGPVEGEGLLFHRDFLFAEEGVARALGELALAEKPQWEVEGLPEHLSDGQVRAVEALARNGVVVLTGGPGTGKSTVLRHVIELALANDMELLLCAPTGRAAKRLEQTTEQEAKTVHRLLEIQGESGEFLYNANNPLPPGLVVVDESSMLDLQLAEALLTSLNESHRLMLVGDADQLPSVGPGNVLRDIIRAADFEDSPVPVVRLNQIFRQAEGSSIVANAHRVLAGESLEPDPPGAKGQFFFTRTSEAARSHEVIVKLASERIPQVYGFDPVSEVQVLCPMHKGKAGTEAFNLALQEVYTADAEALELPAFGGVPARKFRVGDRVMQTRNDYQRGVFNGDIGTVVEVDAADKELRVSIDGVEVPYEQKDLGALRLAYAISIHKSQGSEFPAVLLPILGEHHVMLRRNLLYTAMTRARSLCIVVGDPRAVGQAIARADAAHRWTGLEGRIRTTFVEALGGTVVEPIAH
jgi:exodeoxyribonuclease V alpha subunit